MTSDPKYIRLHNRSLSFTDILRPSQYDIQFFPHDIRRNIDYTETVRWDEHGGLARNTTKMYALDRLRPLDQVVRLQENRQLAFQRLGGLMRKFAREPDYEQAYRTAAQKYIDEAYAKKDHGKSPIEVTKAIVFAALRCL